MLLTLAMICYIPLFSCKIYRMLNFWKNLKKPFFVLAPMDDVTDVVFREVVSEVAPPDMYFTEFTNVDGLQSKGREALMPRLKFTKNQRPIVAQIWGKTPESYFKTAKELKELGFDGIDINMGCPERTVVKNGCCSVLIENRELAKEIIEATFAGAGGLPVSVKTRIGINTVVTGEWINFLLGFDLAAITLHARTAKQMSNGSADWEQIKLAVDIRNQSGKETMVIGNGDVLSREEGLERVKETVCDGIMIGRGIFKNIWIFKESAVFSRQSSDVNRRIRILLRHLELYENEWEDNSKGVKKFDILKKFFKVYISDFEGAAELRAKLMETKSPEEVRLIISAF